MNIKLLFFPGLLIILFLACSCSTGKLVHQQNTQMNCAVLQHTAGLQNIKSEINPNTVYDISELSIPNSEFAVKNQKSFTPFVNKGFISKYVQKDVLTKSKSVVKQLEIPHLKSTASIASNHQKNSKEVKNNQEQIKDGGGLKVIGWILIIIGLLILLFTNIVIGIILMLLGLLFVVVGR